MNIENLLKLAEKPDIFVPGNSRMWIDEHISKQLLQVHLNPEIDLASRVPGTIKQTADWILSEGGKGKMNILDLGCGPGLYSEIFAELGHKVTGVDFSKTSIEYAKTSADEKGLDIDYRVQNYLDLDFIGDFDLVILIYTDYGVLNPNEREILLANIKKALKPGGIFIFDVLSDLNIEQKTAPKSWELSKGGFWNAEPFMALSDSILYPEEKVILYRHIVSEISGGPKTYHFWTSFFNEDDLKEEISKKGFSECGFYRDILPENGLWGGENVIFTKCIKE